MNQTETKRKLHDDLLDQWQQKYQEEILKGAIFSFDGPINWEIWEKANLKILFLLKEAYGDYEPSILPPSIGNNYSKNIARWRYAINALYKIPSNKPEYPDDSLFENPADSFSDIALVEVKKLNENKSKSFNNEINKYAKQDTLYLKKQIELINPNIVFCCYTDEAYDIIYDDFSSKISPRINNCQAFKIGNRLIIEFYHPSYYGKSPIELYDILCEIIIQGQVFSEFDWK